jgi:hypothetical protein
MVGIVVGLVGAAVGVVIGLAGALVGLVVGLLIPLSPILLLVLGIVWLANGSSVRTGYPQTRGRS